MFATEARAEGRTHELVRAQAKAGNFPCDETVIASLSAYAESLLRWNARINLTAARSIEVSGRRSFSRRVRAGAEARPAGTRGRRRQRRRPARDPARAAARTADGRAGRADREEGGVPADRDPRARRSATASRSEWPAARPSHRRWPLTGRWPSTSRSRVRRWRRRSGWRWARAWSGPEAVCLRSPPPTPFPSSPTGTFTSAAAAPSSRSSPRETVPRGTLDRRHLTLRSFSAMLEAELEALAAIDRRRACPEAAGLSRVHPDLGGRSMVSFCSNDYLGLASHPALAKAAAAAAARDGSGASASRLVSGDLPAHRTLESALAAFLGRPAALTFPSGYQTNVGVLTALCGSGRPHRVRRPQPRQPGGRLPPIPGAGRDLPPRRRPGRPQAAGRRRPVPAPPPGDRIAVQHGRRRRPAGRSGRSRRRHRQHPHRGRGPRLGVLGPGGRGLCASSGSCRTSSIGTLGKAVGSAGGFASGVPALRDLLVNRARTFIFTTALPPPAAAAAEAVSGCLPGPRATVAAASSPSTGTLSARRCSAAAQWRRPNRADRARPSRKREPGGWPSPPR